MTPLAVSRGLQITSTLEVRQRRRDRRHAGAPRIRRDAGARGRHPARRRPVRVNYVLVDTRRCGRSMRIRRTAAASDAVRPAGPRRDVGRRCAGAAAECRRAPDAGRQRHAARRGARAVPAGPRLPAELPDRRATSTRDRAVRSRASRSIRATRRPTPGSAARTGRSTRRRRNRRACSRRAPRAPRRWRSIAQLAGSHVCLGTIALGTGAVEDAVQEFQLALEPRADERRGQRSASRARRRERRQRGGRSHLPARDRPAAAVLGDARLARHLLSRARPIPRGGARTTSRRSR